MYASIDDYIRLYSDTELDRVTIEQSLEEASDEIDGLTYNRIRVKGFDRLTAFQQEKVKKAVCIQAKFINDYREMLSSPFSSYSINGVSMAFDGNNIVDVNGIKASKQAYTQLVQTGLARRNLDWWC